MSIAIIGAMREEVKYLIPYLSNLEIKRINNFDFYCGTINSHNVVVVKSGVGKVMSAILFTTLVNNFKINEVINIGVAGGYKNTFIGDIVVGTKYIYSDVDLTLDDAPYGQMSGFPLEFVISPYILSKIDNDYVKLGTILTSDSFIYDFDKIEALINKHFSHQNVLAFDMESASFAQTAYFFNIPFTSIRAISDVVGVKTQANDFYDRLDEVCHKTTLFLLEILKKY